MTHSLLRCGSCKREISQGRSCKKCREAERQASIVRRIGNGEVRRTIRKMIKIYGADVLRREIKAAYIDHFTEQARMIAD